MKKYKSKIDKKILFPIISIIIALSFLMILIKIWVALIIIAVLALFIFHIFVWTYYLITDKSLYIKSGLIINKRIEISKIKKIVETNDSSSSPANSLDRINIYYNKFDEIMISPNEKLDFIDEILKNNSNIEVIMKK